MCHDRHHRDRDDCRERGHHRGREHRRGHGRQDECCRSPHPGHHEMYRCDCPLEEKLIYIERMLAYKKADVAALEAILEVLKESLKEEPEEDE